MVVFGIFLMASGLFLLLGMWAIVTTFGWTGQLWERRLIIRTERRAKWNSR